MDLSRVRKRSDRGETMSYWAKVILPEDETDDAHVIDGETTRYEDLRRITRHSSSPWNHRELVTFERENGETFQQKCVFLNSGEME